MPTMPSLSDYKVEGTNETDWAAYDAANAAYRQAQIDCGEKCQRCHQYMPFAIFGGPLGNTPGYRRTCSSCLSLATSREEVASDHFARCPKCRHSWNPFDNGFAPDEGENEVMCPTCEHEFTLDVAITYSFRSPALEPEPEPEPEPEDDGAEDEDEE